MSLYLLILSIAPGVLILRWCVRGLLLCGLATVTAEITIVTSFDSSSDTPSFRGRLYDDLDPKGTGRSWWLGVAPLIPLAALKLERLLTAVPSVSECVSMARDSLACCKREVVVI